MAEKAMLDGYTLVHTSFGYFARKHGLSYSQIIGLAILYEIVEPSIIRYMREELKTQVWDYEGPKNIIVDILVAPLGAYLADKHSETI